MTPALLAPAIGATIRADSPDAPVSLLAPLDDVIWSSLARRRFALNLLGGFAALAALLTAIGVYGVVGYSLSRSTNEFAIRFALGAMRRDVLGLIMRNFAIPLVAGAGLGLCLAPMFARLLQTQLYRLTPADPVTLAGAVAAVMVLVAAAALRPVAMAASISAAAVPRE